MFDKTYHPTLSDASQWRAANDAKSVRNGVVAALMLLVFLCAACQSSAAPENAAISPTHEIVPTSTATLEPTPTPTSTLTPEPTLTPTPTLTPVPILSLDGLELIWGIDYVKASFLPNQTEGVTRTVLTKDIVSGLDGVSLLPWVEDDLTISTRDSNGNLFLPHPDIIGVQGAEDLMSFDHIDADGFAVFTDTVENHQILPAQIRVQEGFDGDVLLAAESTGENEKIVRVVVWLPDESMYIYVVSDDSVTHGQWTITNDGALRDGAGTPLDGWQVKDSVRVEIMQGPSAAEIEAVLGNTTMGTFYFPSEMYVDAKQMITRLTDMQLDKVYQEYELTGENLVELQYWYKGTGLDICGRVDHDNHTIIPLFAISSDENLKDMWRQQYDNDVWHDRTGRRAITTILDYYEGGYIYLFVPGEGVDRGPTFGDGTPLEIDGHLEKVTPENVAELMKILGQLSE
ncbi:MAG: hypothetical protein ABIG63_19625 [Chloroflexota bacterium]